MIRFALRAVAAAALFGVAASPFGRAPLARAGDARVNPHTIPHVLRYATGEDIDSLNPVLSQHGIVSQLGELTMAYLVRYDRANRPTPELATEVPSLANHLISSDGKTITFHLRRGVKWSDGAPFDGDDVVFTEQQMLNPNNAITSRAGWDQIVKIDQPDKFTLIFHMREAYSPFLPTFFGSTGGNPCILPKHVLNGLASINQAPYNGLPVGIGPFRYVAWKRGDEVDLEANPYYWRGKPKLEKFVYKIIPDRNTVLTALQTGDIDLAWPVGGPYLARYQAIPNVAFIRQPGYYYNLLGFNMTDPVLADKVVRQALRYAMDRQTIHVKIAHGVGYVQESTIPRAYPDAPKIALVPFDLARANKMLDADGWVRGADGIRSKNGRRLTVEFASSAGTPDTDTAIELIRANWQAVGAELTVKRYPSSMMFAPAEQGGIVLGGHFDAVFIAFGVPPLDDLTAVFSCDAIPPNGQNLSHYCNHRLDPILADFVHSYDPLRQADDLNKAQSIIIDDTPMVVLSGREDIFAFSKDLKGFHPNSVSFFDDMMNVDI